MDFRGKGMDFRGKGMDFRGKGMDFRGKGMDFRVAGRTRADVFSRSRRRHLDDALTAAYIARSLCTHTHTRTLKHTHTRARAHARTHAHARARARTRACTHRYIHRCNNSSPTQTPWRHAPQPTRAATRRARKRPHERARAYLIPLEPAGDLGDEAFLAAAVRAHARPQEVDHLRRQRRHDRRALGARARQLHTRPLRAADVSRAARRSLSRGSAREAGTAARFPRGNRAGQPPKL